MNIFRKKRSVLLGALLAGLLLVVIIFAVALRPQAKSEVKLKSSLPSSIQVPLPTVSSLPAKEELPLVAYDSSDTHFARNFLVSDIHGRFDSFKKALDDVHFSKSDSLFVLGDTIDRGPEGFHALLYLTHTLPAEGYHIVVLTGNHEDMWTQMASKGTTDAERLSNIEGTIGIYEGSAPNGWEESLPEWKGLTAAERDFLLKEMLTGFGQPRLLVVKVDNKWLSLSHTVNFTKPIAQQTVEDLSWYNLMQSTDDVYQRELAAQLKIPESQLQVFIGHIGGRRFGVQPHYIDLDNTNTRDFSASPPVQLYELETGKFYGG